VETRILLALHAHAGSLLDLLFRFSHLLGTQRFCSLLVLSAALIHLLRGERREAVAWIAVGVTTVVVIETLKHLIMRPRPELWPRLVTQGGSSFPSGHAVASAAFYPLLAWLLARKRPRLRRPALALGAAVALLIGLGRLYLGLHWPSDVLGGWALGALESTAAIAWLGRTRGAP
jgi:undecaprenyl-diphosphatase